MTFTATVARMSDEELLNEYDWVARDMPVNQHEADAREFKLERMHRVLVRRGLDWS